ncbi:MULTISPECIES: helix-turn-helix domain-containing protein [unclassified Desulfosporosinus]|uniref:helix-turn-helix domain-containing protein n=1 Tax=unclassified Desulfosporosinus TaxID=2633794 RepID=UPI00054C2EB8|nr:MULTISPECIES: helix-turn-helix transcriptional regulator [unclassified Desulfosporosinus]KJS86170.1 MAG: Cro/Cl family transcriptional regulator [Desulfosporosinus sp. BICA1-9]ODA38839.1 Transcriptional regulator, Cro/CI family [Desulfosporosinus sp. BG]
MNISQAVIRRIEELCRERNLSINALSNVSGVTQSTVNDIISGKTYNAGIGTIKKLCDGLGISIRYFFDSDLFSHLEQEIK